MDWPFEFWPIDMPPGPAFLAVYLVLLAAAIGLGAALGRVVEGVLAPRDGEPPVVRTTASEILEAAGLRAGALRVGMLPAPEDCFAVAYLRGGRKGLGEAIVGAAAAHGLVEPGEVVNSLVVCKPRGPLGTPLDELAREISGHTALVPETLHLAATHVVDEHAPLYQVRLDESGLLVPRSVAWTKAAVVGACGALVGAVGVMRLERAFALHHKAGFLFIELLLTPVVLGLAVQRAARRGPNEQGRRYLQWLVDVTQSLREDVSLGRRTAPDELAMALAIGGLAGVAEAPLLMHHAVAKAMRGTFLPVPQQGGAGAGGCGGGGCGGGCGGGGCGGGCGG